MKVLKEAFLAARVVLCQFYAIKWLRKEIASERYRLSVWQKDRHNGDVELLTYAKIESEYLKHRERMRFLLKVSPSSRAADYRPTSRGADGEQGDCQATSRRSVRRWSRDRALGKACRTTTSRATCKDLGLVSRSLVFLHSPKRSDFGEQHCSVEWRMESECALQAARLPRSRLLPTPLLTHATNVLER